ncbi:MAG TPA: demethoxyubiquinone hydroxylase family protein [Candidatus Acidoferrum sp.]|nr:demethoxyubiquinone hydroxylase family protein [Candidatus Acidoferrum sp.]
MNDDRRRDDDQLVLLLRVGVGAVWLYEGLVCKLLAPAPRLLDLIVRWQPFPGEPMAYLKAWGAFESLLGLLLIWGWMIRSIAAVQCGLLAFFSAGLAILMPQALADPMDAIPKNVALFAIGLCLVLLADGRQSTARRPWVSEAVPMILRLGLGFMWIYEGIVFLWFSPSPAAVEIVARSRLVPLHIPTFLRLLGLVEIGLAGAILAGLWIRGLAVLQVGLLSAFTAIVGWTSPQYLIDPLGSLARNLGLLSGVLALYRTGGGSRGMDAWLDRNALWCRCRVLASLRWNWMISAAAMEVYRVQSQAAADPNMHALLEKLTLDEMHRAEDLTALIRRHGGRLIPVAPLVRVVAWLLGCLTVIFGRQASLRFDLWLEEQKSILCARCADRLPPEAGITARALLGMQNRQAQHIRLLKDHLRALRGPTRR